MAQMRIKLVAEETNEVALDTRACEDILDTRQKKSSGDMCSMTLFQFKNKLCVWYICTNAVKIQKKAWKNTETSLGRRNAEKRESSLIFYLMDILDCSLQLLCK